MANFNFNLAILGGRLTSDPELKTSQSGTEYCNFIIASTRRAVKDAQPAADFVTCKAFGKTAEFISKYFHKGSSIQVVGRITTGSYEKNGQKIFTTDIYVSEVNFVDSKGDGQVQSAPTASVQSAGYVPDNYTQATLSVGAAGPAPSFEDIQGDDDLPF